MGIKLLWSGLTLIQAAFIFNNSNGLQIAGAIIMVLGCILMLIDK